MDRHPERVGRLIPVELEDVVGVSITVIDVRWDRCACRKHQQVTPVPYGIETDRRVMLMARNKHPRPCANVPSSVFGVLKPWQRMVG
ncbi:hypothetical protein D3C85_1268900 [compost metagenome]